MTIRVPRWALALFTGVVVAVGMSACQSQTEQAKPRPAEVLYLSPVSSGTEVWRVEPGGASAPEKITQTNGKVRDFSAGENGEWLYYSAENEQGGTDIWKVRWDGNGEKQLLVCGTKKCRGAIVSPNGQYVAYSKQVYSQNLTQTQIWLLNLDSGEVNPLTSDDESYGRDPSWSPDGKYLAFYDERGGGVRVFDLANGTSVVFESNEGAVGSWSPDSKQLLITHSLSNEAFPYVKAFLVTLETGEQREMLGDEANSTDFSTPVFSPGGQWVAVGLRPAASSIGKQIWVMRLDGSEARAVTDDPQYAHAGARWSPDGMRLVYQRLALTSSSSRPEIWVWEMGSGVKRLLATDAALPVWLP